MNKREYPPATTGRIEINHDRHGVFIGGDPDGLLSLSKLLKWLAKADQDADAEMPDGARLHVHLHPGSPGTDFASLTEWSRETEVCRLDAKGSGAVPSGPFRGGKGRSR